MKHERDEGERERERRGERKERESNRLVAVQWLVIARVIKQGASEQPLFAHDYRTTNANGASRRETPAKHVSLLERNEKGRESEGERESEG